MDNPFLPPTGTEDDPPPSQPGWIRRHAMELMMAATGLLFVIVLFLPSGWRTW